MANPSKKTKINKKFILLVGGFVLFAGVVLGGIFYWSYSAAPERNIRLGDELVLVAQAADKAGNSDEAYKKFQEAIGRYGRAVSKKPNNLEYAQKVIDALSLMTPKTSGDAQELYQRRESYMQKCTRSAPKNGEVWLQLINSMNERAELFGQSDMWKRISEVCDDALDRVPPSDANFLVIQGFGICAELNRSEVLTDEERTIIETAAEDYLKKNPQNEFVWGTFLHAIAFDIQRLSVAGKTIEVATRERKFDELLAQSKSVFPKSSEISISELQNLLLQKKRRNPIATPKAIQSILDPLLWKNGDRESPEFGECATLSGNKLIDIANITVNANDPIASQRSIQSLQNYCTRFPDAIVEINQLGKLQVATDQLENAQATFEELLAKPSLKVSMLAAFSDEIKSNALQQIFNIEFGRWEAAIVPSDKSVTLAKAQLVRDRLSKVLAGRDGELALLQADAKLAFARGDYLSTVTKLEEVFAKQKDVPAELYYLSVVSLNARGEQGAALSKITDAIQEFPQVGQFYLIRAGIEARLGRLMDAKRSIASLLAREPENAEGLRMMAELKKVPGDGAINLTDPIIKILGDAELLGNEGDVEAAMTQIRDARVTYPNDLRLQRTLCQWLLFQGKTKEAQEAVAEFLVAAPNDPILKQLQILATIPSALGRITTFVNLPKPDGSLPAEDEKAVALAVGLTTLRDNLKQRLQVTAPEDQAKITADLDEVTTAAKAALAKATELAPGDTTLIDRLFSESVADKKPEQFDQLVLMAEKNCKDKTIPILLRGRIALERKDFNKAVELFEQAVEMPGASAAAFRLLAIAREQAGDIDGAIEAFATSYQRRPDDLVTVQLYSAILMRAGKTQNARALLRAAMLAMPESPAIRNSYFDLESVYGNLADSIVERKRMFSIRPSDIENARQLMKLLVESPPSRELITNDDGSFRFPQVEWDAMGRDRQEQELRMIAETNDADARMLYASLLKLNPNDRLSSRIYAAAMQRAGRGREAEALLFAVAEKTTGETAWEAWVELGESQIESSRNAQAAESFQRAVGLDTSKSMEASRVISNLWSQRRQSALALQVLEAAYLKQPNIDFARSISALRLETRDFVGAQAMSLEVTKLSNGKPSFNDQLLTIDIANAALEESFSSLDVAETKRISEDFMKAIDEAIRLQPASALPFVVRATSFQRQFQRSGNIELSRKAISDVQRAIELQGNYWPATRLLASIQMDDGDISAAIQTVRKFIGQMPRSSEARKALVAYQLTSGDYDGAIQTVQDILKLEPRNPSWIRLLAETHIAASQKLEAAKDNQRIFEITRNPDALTQSVLLRVINSPPDFAGILESLQAAPELVPQNPFFQMIGAAAIAGTATTQAQKNQGLVQLREMYKLVETAKGGLTDQWMIAVGSLFVPDPSQKFEPFVLEACFNKLDTHLCRALAQRFLDSNSESIEKALLYGKKALELATSDNEKFNAYRVLGGAEYKAGNYVEAAKCFEQSLTIQSDDLAAINNLAFLEAKELNKVPQAVERARKAFAINQNNADLMDTLGFALMKSGQIPEALSLLRRSARSQPTAMAYAHLAQAQFLAGRKDEARISLDRAKALRPDIEAQKEIDEASKSFAAEPRG